MAEKNPLNPDGLKDIEEVLKKDSAEQLWFFLDDSIPTKEKDSYLQFVNDMEWQSQICMGTDYCYFAESVKELEEVGLGYMKSYLPLLKECYLPYMYTVETNPKTPEQEKKLSELESVQLCKATIEKQNNDDVPVTIILMYPGMQKQTQAYLTNA